MIGGPSQQWSKISDFFLGGQLLFYLFVQAEGQLFFWHSFKIINKTDGISPHNFIHHVTRNSKLASEWWSVRQTTCISKKSSPGGPLEPKYGKKKNGGWHIFLQQKGQKIRIYAPTHTHIPKHPWNHFRPLSLVKVVCKVFSFAKGCITFLF